MTILTIDIVTPLYLSALGLRGFLRRWIIIFAKGN